MPQLPYRTLRILLRVFSLSASLGGLLMIFAEKPSRCKSFCARPKEKCPRCRCRC